MPFKVARNRLRVPLVLCEPRWTSCDRFNRPHQSPVMRAPTPTIFSFYTLSYSKLVQQRAQNPRSNHSDFRNTHTCDIRHVLSETPTTRPKEKHPKKDHMIHTFRFSTTKDTRQEDKVSLNRPIHKTRQKQKKQQNKTKVIKNNG